ncbi:hypothetical protein AAHA92_00913 [Salvia divinorum]|uniref:Uncharacterized protein n=1 Tax=Salvia divinorum TaxID=28513 RepID=A0ABD1INH4_SALDI
MALNIPHQREFFYKKHWTPEMDMLLIQTIVQKKKQVQWGEKVVPDHFIHKATSAIQKEFGCGFTWAETYERFLLLESRYHCFKEVIDTIFKKNKLAEAYYHNGESIFEELTMLFGEEQVKAKDDEQTVIILSDSSDKAPLDDPVISPLQAWSEEVNSPVWQTKEKTRRKLFVDADHASDRCSTNEKKIHLYTVGLEGKMETKVVGVQQLKRSEVASEPKYSPQGSSCASCSPIGWRAHLDA